MQDPSRHSQPQATQPGTDGRAYHDRLLGLQDVWWKRILPVQAPYRLHLRRLALGRTLDVGCGLGRLLAALPPGSVGVDHNPDFVRHVRAMGHAAYLAEDFFRSVDAVPNRFDAILMAHVVEHLDADAVDAIFEAYSPFLRPGGAVHLVTPQEFGYASDPTHVQFVDFTGLEHVARRNGFEVERVYSFPFPRMFGRIFKYNEFHLHGRKPKPLAFNSSAPESDQ